MPKYYCELALVGETIFRKTIEAPSIEEAEDKMREMYDNDELEETDFNMIDIIFDTYGEIE